MQPMAQQAAEKVIPERELSPQRLKPHSKQCSYRSGKALRHPKSSETRVFPQAVKSCPSPNPPESEFFRDPLSQTESDGYHLAATASRGNMIAWQYLAPWPGDEFYGGATGVSPVRQCGGRAGRPALHRHASWNDARFSWRGFFGDLSGGRSGLYRQSCGAGAAGGGL